jgi:SMODS and SLOG-associating 2TM effector domain 3
MRHEDYPWLLCASDEASGEAQKWYFRFLTIQLILFFLIGLLGSIQRLLSSPIQRHTTVAISVLLAFAIITTLLGRERKLDKVWFDSRAVAESAKTATWRFMMGAPPFQPQPTSNIEAALLSELDEIKNARPGIDEHLSGRAPNVQPISDYMRNLRLSDFATRKSAPSGVDFTATSDGCSATAALGATSWGLPFVSSFPLTANVDSSSVQKRLANLSFSPSTVFVCFPSAYWTVGRDRCTLRLIYRAYNSAIRSWSMTSNVTCRPSSWPSLSWLSRTC